MGETGPQLSEAHADSSTLAFAAGKVAYYEEVDDLGGTGPLLLGDVHAQVQQIVPGTSGVSDARVAGGPDGFVAVWSVDSGTGSGVRLVRMRASGEVLWDVDIEAPCACYSVSTLAVAGDFILADQGIYALSDGKYLRAAPQVRSAGALYWYSRVAWTPEPLLSYYDGAEDQGRDLNLATGKVGPEHGDVYSIESAGWRVTLTPGPSEDVGDVTEVRAVGPGGRSWSFDATETSLRASAQDRGVVIRGEQLYATQGDDRVIIFDLSTGRQLAESAAQTDSRLVGLAPGAIPYVVTGSGSNYVSWTW